MPLFKIGNKEIGDNQPSFIVAEIGANHNGDINLAKKLILEAKSIDCDCVKFQTYKTEDFCVDKKKQFTYFSKGKKITESEFEMFKRLEFNNSEWREIFNFCLKEKIIFFTTIQDIKSLKLMLSLGIPAIKVGSDDFDFIINLKEYAKTGLPLILSRGMSGLGEIDETINSLRTITNKLAVLHCISEYPVKNENINLRQLTSLINLYPDIIWGFSDHSIGTQASCAAVVLGAKIIEKHFTLSHDLDGPDHWFSADTNEMKKLIKDIRITEKSLGSSIVKRTKNEYKSKLIMRRKIVTTQDLSKNSILRNNNVYFKRFDVGISVKLWDKIKGKRINKSIKKNKGIKFKDIIF